MSASSALRHWLGEVSSAAAALESRWTGLALRRVDPDLALRLHEQRCLFDEACFAGVASEIEEQGAAMCRGYAAAVRALVVADAPDDAYMLGLDSASGCKVAIGLQKAALSRVREVHGHDVIWITPDEVAVLMASVESFKFVGAVKQFFPGAEIIQRYQEAGT